MIKVAFIDDGINPEFIPSHIPFDNYTADETGVHLSKPVDNVSHGTMCCQIFNNNTNTPYHLTSIQVLDNTTGTGSHKALVTALNWCATQDFDLINMSMGTRQYLDFAPIAAAVGSITKSIIVAACSNNNELTFPACLPSVIGVRHCNQEELIGNFAYLHNPYDQIEVATCVRDEPVSLGENHIEKMSGANSFATPLITARVCDYIGRGYKTMAAVRKQLEQDSIKNTSFITYEFYKNRTLNWEECAVPIVAIPDTAPEANHKLQALLDVFIQDGYRAIALSDTTETNATNFIYNLNRHGQGKVSLPELIELYYNFTLPDILFLQMPMGNFAMLPANMQADVVVKLPEIGTGGLESIDVKHIFSIIKPTNDLFVEITRALK